MFLEKRGFFQPLERNSSTELLGVKIMRMWVSQANMSYVYIYMVTPPTTRTPLKSTVKTDTNAVFFFPNPILELFLQLEDTSAKHKKSKNPKAQKSKNLKIQKSKEKCKIPWM